MRTASLVLGIVGGILAIIISFIMIGVGVAAAALTALPYSYTEEFGEEFSQEFADEFNEEFAQEFAEGMEDANIEWSGDVDYNTAMAAAGAGIAWIWISGILGVIGGVLGIIGGAMAKKKNVLAGVFMLVGGGLSALTGIGLIATACLVTGGILALIKEKPAQAPPPPYAPAPMQ